MATDFTVNKADLEFILRQIRIAEATSVAYTPAVAPISTVQAIQNEYGIAAANAVIAPFGLRTVDGTNNNLVANQSEFGAADNLFPRLTDPVFRNDADGDTMPLGPPGSGAPTITNTNYDPTILGSHSVADADPRIISNLIVDMSVNNPAAIAAYLGNPLSLGQFEADHAGMTPVDPADIATAPLLAAWLAAHPGETPLALTDTDLQTIPNQSPDIGLSPGFNAWMTFFGQFFDHGLDLVTKGGNGTVYVPLQVDDPLFDPGPDLDPSTLADNGPNFMALTRATVTLDANGVPQHENTTTSFVDQNQTYTSHASHQVFLREYVKVDIDGAGGNGPVAISTGKMLDGGAPGFGTLVGAIGNWAEVKAQALTMLGISLNDFDVHNAPLLLTDQYGKFIAGPNGYAQMVMAPVVDGNPAHLTNWLKEGTAAGITTAGSIGTGHAFLNDIAHHAAPGTWDHDNNPMTAKIDQTADTLAGVADDGLPGTYDDEMLNSHMITGDGRGNENIALTTVHSIFHSEHNRLVGVNKATILQSNDLAFLNEWLLVDVASLPVIPANATPAQLEAIANTLTWDGDRIFQAARFGTEMQYQHMVFEEFARRIQPMVDPFIFNTSPNVDPSIVAEFAHTVYRFGHSMLTGTVDRLENDLTTVNGELDQKTLLAVFLNPQAYLDSGADLEAINANIIRGLSRDVGNAMDEFIVTNVRSQLLGLPLDLAVLNLARGRDTGVPSLNETREQLYNDTGLADLKPYTSWLDFALNIKNAASVINFIAAYGTHSTITSATTVADKRLAAEELVFGVDGDDADALVAGGAGDRIAFLNATGTYAANRGGLDFVDLWIGGLAEKSPEFGGMLGTTFNYVFEAQMESLQFGDRFYYLTRTQGTNFLNNLEPNTFSDIVMRNTDLGDQYSTHLYGQLFVTPDHIIELDRGIAQTDYNGAAAGNDPEWDGSNPVMEAILGPKVVRGYTATDVPGYAGNGDVSANGHDEGGYLRVIGGEHFVLGGTEGADIIYGDSGMDTIWGDGGNDYLNGGTEADDVFGGAGDDIIEDPFGEGDVLRGNDGNDVVTAANGADLLFGNAGQDYLVLGADAAEVFGGEGTDFILGGAGKDFLLGNEGSDWIEGGAGFDTIAGENSELFFNSPIIGHDVLFGQGDETDYDAESGDDIMASGPSVFRYEGMFGFDWGIGKGDLNSGVDFDLQIPIFTTIPEDVLRDRFDQVEALSGWKYSDILDGDDRGHKGGGSSAPDSVPTELFAEHLLTQEGVNRIDGFNAWFQGARNTLFGAATPIPGTTSLAATTYRDGNILLGGDGSDFLRGRGGYDLLDGDAYLNVRIKIVIPAGQPNAGTYSAESMNSDVSVAGEHAGKVYNVYTAADQAADPTHIAGAPNFASEAFGGRSLTSLMLDRTINPGQMSIVREILYDTTPNNNTDTAIFQGTLAEYEIEGRISGIVNDGGTVSSNSASWRPAFDVNGDGFISVRDKDTGAVGAIIVGPDGLPLQLTSSRGALTDDMDLLKNIEILRFADQSVVIAGNNHLATGTVTIADLQNKLVNPADVSTTYDLDGNPATPALVTPYVGQVLTASLSGVVDADGYPGSPGLPTGLTFLWQTTETGGNAGWSDIGMGATYTVRSVDPGHILRAVAVFQDNNGATETIISTATDGATAPFNVPESSPSGTVVAASIPFNPDYDPDQTPGGPTDGDIVVLTHVLADNAGGRFQLVTVGGVQQIQVLDGGSLDYETDNEHQIVIDSYIDAASAAALDPAGRIASRQFTVLLSDVEVEDIKWNPPAVGATTTPSDTALPGVNGVLGTLTSTSDSPTTFTYSLVSQTSPGGGGFSINPTTGVVTRTGSAMAINTTYTLVVTSTPANGTPARTETFTIKTGSTSDSLGGVGSSARGTGGDDILFTLQGNDTPFGLEGNDILYGQAGNDRLDGGLGADYMAGGAGDDTYVVDNVGDVVNERTGAPVAGVPQSAGGTDTVETTLASYTLSQSVNNLVFTGTGNFVGTGRDDDGNTITGGAGNDTLNGLAGNDTLIGLGGNDTLNGGLNDDTLTGGAGGDTLNGDGGIDTASYAGSDAAVNINLLLDTASGGHAQGDNLNLIENVTGSSFNDTLIGDTGANALVGGDGDDLLVGGVGADFLDGQGGTDTADYRASSAAVNINRQTDAYSGGHAQGDNLDSIENVIGSAFGDTLTGNAEANQLFGGAGNDTINGGDGIDLIDGGTGNDTLNGGTGGDADTIVGGEGDDTIDVADGNDVIRYAASGFGADIITTFDATGGTGTTQDRIDLSALGITAANLGTRVIESTVGANTLLTVRDASLTTIGTIQVNGITNANIDATDYILATAGSVINGTAGNNTLNGTGGNDTITGGLGVDTINAGAGDDTIIWNAGGGGAGDGRDVVNGGTEGAAGDTFVVNGNASTETFTIYTRAAAIAAMPALTFAVGTEIVVRRQSTGGTDVIVAELSEIEEIRINGVDPAGATGAAGPDTFNIVGDFTGTSLRLNTITIDGDAGDDTVDISALSSAHRIVFRSNGGNDTIIGNMRPQDVIELAAGATAADYTTTTAGNGVSTMTNGTHSVTFTAPSGMPQVGNDDEDDDSDGNDDGNANDDDDTAGNDDDDDNTAGNDDNCGCDGEDDTDTTSGPLPPASGVRMGTPMADVLTGTVGDDDIIGLAGDDYATGGAGADAIAVGEGADFVNGGDGRDVIFAGAGDDQVFAGAQADVIYGDAGADRIFGDAGNDMINAGAGDDAVFGGAGNDLIVAEIGDGNDVYLGDNSDGGAGIDTLDMSAGTVNATVNLGSGPLSNGTASSSQTGNDTIWGIENVNTGSGNDTITASNAANVMNGGSGNDTYRFTSASAADGDTILGFEPGDRVDLTAIDTNSGTPGDQSFTLVTGAFTAAGQLAVTFSGDVTVITGNVDGDAAADFTIEIAGNHSLTPGGNLGL